MEKERTRLRNERTGSDGDERRGKGKEGRERERERERERDNSKRTTFLVRPDPSKINHIPTFRTLLESSLHFLPTVDEGEFNVHCRRKEKFKFTSTRKSSIFE